MSERSAAYVVSASARIPAPPARVYGIIADYRNGHPRILPDAFSDLTVEAGGVGDGTVIRFTMTLFGRRYEFRAAVTEPEPGRVLVERNTGANSAVTSFTVDRGDAAEEAVVTIRTEMPGRSGISGAIERFVTRRTMLRLYRDELARLAQVAAARS